ncbi:unnamed protein product [Fusarium venenatum]|uniref:Uncharacterized protein n=1 Tax=Fusarium venenatum TaxID=56646 RepID=A0A2L2TWT5_9HYPO|nr:uncharacterized protein FVRRES_01557 [Fusarium venenatum]CEI65045.1 unnamed protein product [Fusarium venenatum]
MLTYLEETTLEACDITFPITASNTTTSDFKVILSSPSELQSQEGKARVERLFLMQGGEHVAVILLLDGEDSMLGFSNVQAEYVIHSCVGVDIHTDWLLSRWLCWDYAMPMIPITTIKTLPVCLESLQQDYSKESSQPDTDANIASRDLLRWCVCGKPLSRDQVNILTEITSGFGDLGGRSSLLNGRAVIREYLGNEDGGRLLSFLTNDFSKTQG